MKKISFLFILCFIALKSFSLDIYVSPSFTNNNLSNYQKTLNGAYNRLLYLYPGKVLTDQSVNIYILGDTYIAESPSSIKTITWDISGTIDYSINITSGIDGNPQILRPLYDTDKRVDIIELAGVNYVSISNLVFPESTRGIFINSSSYCTIQGCKFIWNELEIDGSQGGGMITISRWPEPYTPTNLPEGNKISNNYLIENGTLTATGSNGDSPAWPYWQGIYLGNSINSDVSYNTIINPSGQGISYYHGYAFNNSVVNNIINVCKECGNYCEQPHNKAGIVVSYGDCNSCGPEAVSGNTNIQNYITFSEELPYSNTSIFYSPNYSHSFIINYDLLSNNPNYTDNYFSYANTSSGMYTIDPYWVDYDANMVTDRFVSGDFDGDGKLDDIAALYDSGYETSQIHLWLNQKSSYLNHGYYERDKCFMYIGNVWTSSVFDANKVTGRFVSGDFNGDGKTDIAAMYDYENSTSKIIVWLNSGNNSFNSFTWWSSSVRSYDANMVTGRLAAGDYNGDGKTDIAAMYDYGYSSSRIHVWYSNGSSFNNPTTPWTGSSYDANKVTGRFISGDFSGDGKADIAAMYDYEDENSRIHIWYSKGASFDYPSTEWISGAGSFDANMVTGRFISADLVGDGKSDLTAMYNYGNSTSRIFTWPSLGSSLDYPISEWISVSGSYDTDKVAGRFIAGDFNNSGKFDICVMYDYTYNNSFHRTRYHVWESFGNSLIMQNNSLGYPWMQYSTEIGMNCSSGPSKVLNKLKNSDLISTDDDIETQEYFKIFPNPANSSITIESSMINIESRVIIYNILGMEFIKLEKLKTSTSIDISKLPNGIYFIEFSCENETIIKQFIKN